MKSKPTFVQAKEIELIPASHEDPNDPGVLKKVLIAKNIIQPGKVQMVNFALLPAGKSFNRHYHEDMDEVFILLTGTAQMSVDDQIFPMTEHDVVVVPAMCHHEVKNNSEVAATYVVFGVSRDEGGKTINV